MEKFIYILKELGKYIIGVMLWMAILSISAIFMAFTISIITVFILKLMGIN
jgi:hypothetical protein